MTVLHGLNSGARLRRGSHILAAALALSAILSAPAAFAQSAEEKAAARDLATRGIQALDEKKYAEALDLISRAEQILHAPTHLLLIGRAQVGLGRLVEAKETFLKLSREEIPASAPAAFQRAQEGAKDEIAAIEPKIASLRIELEGAKDKKVTLKIDDKVVPPALIGVYRPIDPGKHEIVAYPMGLSPVKGAVELGEGEKKEIKLAIPEGPAPTGVPLRPEDDPDTLRDKRSKDTKSPGFFTPLRTAGIGLGALGLGGVIVGAIFTAQRGSTQSDADALAAACGNACSKAQQDEILALDDDAATQGTIGTIGFVAGGVSLAAGVTLIVLGKPKPKAQAARVEPWIGGNIFGVRGAF